MRTTFTLSPLELELMRAAEAALKHAQTVITERFTMVCASRGVRDGTLIRITPDGCVTLEVPDAPDPEALASPP